MRDKLTTIAYVTALTQSLVFESEARVDGVFINYDLSLYRRISSSDSNVGEIWNTAAYQSSTTGPCCDVHNAVEYFVIDLCWNLH